MCFKPWLSGVQFLEQKYGYYHCRACNLRWESAYVWCVQGTNKVMHWNRNTRLLLFSCYNFYFSYQVYFKQFCRKCQKEFNPYRVEDITCHVRHLSLPTWWNARDPPLTIDLNSRSATRHDVRVRRLCAMSIPNDPTGRICAAGARANGCPATAPSASSTSSRTPIANKVCLGCGDIFLISCQSFVLVQVLMLCAECFEINYMAHYQWSYLDY